MMNLFRKTILSLALGAATLTTASPALADGWRGRHHGGGGDDAAIAIGAGVVGLALGAAIASSGRDDRRYDGDYYYEGDYPRYRQYYYYREGPRYRGSYYRPHHRGGYDRGYNRGGYNRGWHNDRGRRDWRDHRGHGRGW